MLIEIFSKKELIAQVFNLNNINNSIFPTPEDKTFQFGCSHEKNDRLIKTHIHKENKRIINSTSEFIYVIDGKMKFKIYDRDEKFIDEIILKNNMALLQFSGGHQIKIKKNTKFFELKQGPYMGRNYDKYDLNLEND
tara:strand:- start:1145 stop:1555 length:411 start_codon:yes stop_codon:yes gene_type:complete